MLLPAVVGKLEVGKRCIFLSHQGKPEIRRNFPPIESKSLVWHSCSLSHIYTKLKYLALISGWITMKRAGWRQRSTSRQGSWVDGYPHAWLCPLQVWYPDQVSDLLGEANYFPAVWGILYKWNVAIYSCHICLLDEWYILDNTLGTVGNKTMIPPSNLLDFKRQGTWWKEEAHIKTSIDSFCIQHREGSPLYLSSQIWMETFCCSSHMCKKKEICRWRVMGELQFPRGKHDRLFPSLQRCNTDISARAVYSEDCIGFSQMIQLDSPQTLWTHNVGTHFLSLLGLMQMKSLTSTCHVFAWQVSSCHWSCSSNTTSPERLRLTHQSKLAIPRTLQHMYVITEAVLFSSTYRLNKTGLVKHPGLCLAHVRVH